MPIFVYKCDKCGVEEERLVHTSKGEIEHVACSCFKCDGHMQRQVTAPARTSSRWGDTNSCRL
jgi:putative FmdB family regulatory protein